MALSALVVAVYAVLMIWLVSWPRSLGLRTALLFLAVGALTCTILVYIPQWILLQFFSADALSFTAGPVAEELLKAAPLFVLFFMTATGRRIGPLDGLVLGVAIGAGFDLAEIVLTTLRGFAVSDAGRPLSRALPGALWVWPFNGTERGFIEGSPLYLVSHHVWTGLVGFGIGFARFLASRSRVAYAVPVFLLAWVTYDHAAFNYFAVESGFFGIVVHPTLDEPVLSVLSPLEAFGARLSQAFIACLLAGIILEEAIMDKTIGARVDIPHYRELPIRFFLLSEVVNSVKALRYGPRHLVALWGFYMYRRQVAHAWWHAPETSILSAHARDLRERVRRLDSTTTSGGILRAWVSDPLRSWMKAVVLPFALVGRTVRRSPTVGVSLLVLMGATLVPLMTLFVCSVSASLFLLNTGWAREFHYADTLTLTQGMVRAANIIGFILLIYAAIHFALRPSPGPDSDANVQSAYWASVFLVTAGLGFVAVGLFAALRAGSAQPLLGAFLGPKVEGYSEGVGQFGGWPVLFSMMLGFIPVVGEFKDIYEAWTGEDAVTGEKLTPGERLLTLAGALLPVISATALRYGRRALDAMELAEARRHGTRALHSAESTVHAG